MLKESAAARLSEKPDNVRGRIAEWKISEKIFLLSSIRKVL
jgi:hypothetical protein